MKRPSLFQKRFNKREFFQKAFSKTVQQTQNAKIGLQQTQ